MKFVVLSLFVLALEAYAIPLDYPEEDNNGVHLQSGILPRQANYLPPQ